MLGIYISHLGTVHNAFSGCIYVRTYMRILLITTQISVRTCSHATRYILYAYCLYNFYPSDLRTCMYIRMHICDGISENSAL